jgi:hypothetical protein
MVYNFCKDLITEPNQTHYGVLDLKTFMHFWNYLRLTKVLVLNLCAEIMKLLIYYDNLMNIFSHWPKEVLLDVPILHPGSITAPWSVTDLIKHIIILSLLSLGASFLTQHLAGLRVKVSTVKRVWQACRFPDGTRRKCNQNTKICVTTNI